MRSIKGVYDILPDGPTSMMRSEAWAEVERTIRSVMHQFSYEEIRTPLMEPLELVARGVGAETDLVTKEMFTLERGEKHYVLRPEMTAPVMRAYLQHQLGQRPADVRLYYIGPCFRAERPQKGRYRQFHQFGAEILGPSSPEADAEIIVCMMEVYRAAGIDNTALHINTLGDSHSRALYTRALQKYFAPLQQSLTPISRKRLESNPLRILDTKNESERALLEDAPMLIDYVDEESLRHHEKVKALLSDVGISFTEDPFLVRGLDYYSRTAFELLASGIGAQSALAGGGRYDGLSVSIGSKMRVPGVGFAAGVERLFLAREAAGVSAPEKQPPDAFLIGLGSFATRETFRLALMLRRAGLRVRLGLQKRSMKKQMRVAHRLGAHHAIIIGDNELACQQAQVKNMSQGTQERVSFDALPRYLLSHPA